jgi:hypothetical protein
LLADKAVRDKRETPGKDLAVDERLEQLLQTTSSPPTRRAVMRGLAGLMGAAGMATLVGQEDTSARRRRRRRRSECRRNSQCKAALNPCHEAGCKNNRCRTKTIADGTVCGDGLVCQDGACLCPDGVCTVLVTPSDLRAWVALDTFLEVDTSLLDFQNGPGTPPFGSGSVNLTVTDESFALVTYQFSGVYLSDITAMEYSTYQPSTNTDSPTKAGKLALTVDFFGSPLQLNGILFDPELNPVQVLEDTWQIWDAINNGTALWSGDGCSCDWPNSSIPSSTPRTWTDLVASYPNARINITDPMVGVIVENDSGTTFAENINSVTFGTTSGTTRYVFGPA